MKQQNYSCKREAIYNYLAAVKTHPSVETIYAALKEKYPDLSLGTVYRNIAMFKKNGTICSVGVVDGEERYDFNTEPHAHFICEGCNAIIDLDNMQIDKQLDYVVQEAYNAKVYYHQLVFFGKCSKCKLND